MLMGMDDANEQGRRQHLADWELRRHVHDLYGAGHALPVELLLQHCRNNAIVACMIDAWKCGRFSTFEQCLVAMCVALAEQNERMERSVQLSVGGHIKTVAVGEQRG